MFQKNVWILQAKLRVKIKVMINHIVLLIAIFFFTEVKAQEENIIKIKSINGTELKTVDSLSFRDNLKKSPYYIESSNEQRYTGKAIVYYGIKAIDSISIENGYQNGWQKTYFRDGDSLKLGEVKYLNQNQLMSVSYPINPKLRSNIAFCNYLSEKGHYFIEVIYKRSGKIVVKELVKGKKSKPKKKYRFSNILELELFFRKHYQIYPYCKQAGFFGQPEIK